MQTLWHDWLLTKRDTFYIYTREKPFDELERNP
jgi:hypothetical protein